mgnify:CR=1 FL=1
MPLSILPILVAFTFNTAPPIALRVTPPYCMAPCTPRIDITVPRDQSNRYFVLELEGPIFSSSMTSLEGAQAAIRHTRFLPKLPDGEYIITAIIYNTTREYYRASVNLTAF